MRKIHIFDTTLRDGEQVPGAKLNGSQKLEVARQLAKLRVDVIEAGFPCSSPDDAKAVESIAREIGNLENAPAIAGLARAVANDVLIAWNSVKYARRPRIHIFIGASDIHIEAKLRTDRETIKLKIHEIISYAKNLCRENKLAEIEFSFEDASRADFEYICCLSRIAIRAGAGIINLPDTVGYSEPEEFGRFIANFREQVPEINRCVLSVHCHNDLGMATANTMAAIKAGADQVEVTINGIGERAGNAAIEEVVAGIAIRKDIYGCQCDVDATQIYPASRLVRRLMNIRVQPNKAVVGKNAFAHSSGVHQDGILKDRRTYEIMRPQDFGIPPELQKLKLTARSGRAALKNRLADIGYLFEEKDAAVLERIYQRFIGVADRKKEISSADLQSIVDIEISMVPETFTFVDYQITSGTKIEPMAKVRMKKGEQIITDFGTGDGPVDAVINAVECITGVQGILVEYDLTGVGIGRDTLGEATGKVEIGDATYTGIGTSPDVIEASARAFLNAINRYLANGGVAAI
jgi:2-isopropylmalate synthase